MFSILCGCTLGEYIRARRLTLAGSELASSDAKVIDVALKYGYDSPESFCRAFTKFHGISPSQAKVCGSSLRSFSRLSVKLILEGGTMMDYRIEKESAFKVLAKSKAFKNHTENEYDVDLNEIPKFWEECHKDGTIKTLRKNSCGALFGDSILGICRSDYCGSKEEFLYSIATGYNGKEVPKGFDICEIPENTWAVFKATDRPEDIKATWKKIFSEFFPTSDYSPKNDIDFEVYADSETDENTLDYEIWIPVEKK